MATTQNPIIGSTKGSFATAVFSRSFGKNIIRTKPANYSDAKSPTQLLQRDKLILANQFYQNHKDKLDSGFKSVSKNRSATASAKSYILKNVITWYDGAWAVDWSKAIFSLGPVPLVTDITRVIDPETGAEIYTFNPCLNLPGANTNDKVFMYIVNTDLSTSLDLFVSRVSGGFFQPSITNYLGEGGTFYIYFWCENQSNWNTSGTAVLGPIII